MTAAEVGVLLRETRSLLWLLLVIASAAGWIDVRYGAPGERLSAGVVERHCGVEDDCPWLR